METDKTRRDTLGTQPSGVCGSVLTAVWIETHMGPPEHEITNLKYENINLY